MIGLLEGDKTRAGDNTREDSKQACESGDGAEHINSKKESLLSPKQSVPQQTSCGSIPSPKLGPQKKTSNGSIPSPRSGSDDAARVHVYLREDTHRQLITRQETPLPV